MSDTPRNLRTYSRISASERAFPYCCIFLLDYITSVSSKIPSGQQGLADFHCFHWAAAHRGGLTRLRLPSQTNPMRPPTKIPASIALPLPRCVILIEPNSHQVPTSFIILSKYLLLTIRFRVRVQCSHGSCRLATLNFPKAWTPWYRSSNTRVLQTSVSP